MLTQTAYFLKYHNIFQKKKISKKMGTALHFRKFLNFFNVY